jgi:hypothetical protein
VNKHDRDNLQFLLSADKSTMDQWYQTVSEDDVEYALELLQLHRTELELRELEIIDTEAETDLSDAHSVLTRFTLH